MYEVTRKVTCDKCGAEITRRDEWALALDRWIEEDNSYTSWKAELCDVCKELVLTGLLALVSMRYSKE